MLKHLPPSSMVDDGDDSEGGGEFRCPGPIIPPRGPGDGDIALIVPAAPGDDIPNEP